MASSTYDYIIIGAGIAGVSLGAELVNASPEARVLMLEAGAHPGMQATGRSAAYFAPSYGNDVVRTLTADSEAYFREWHFIQNRPALFVGRAAQAQAMEAMRVEQPHLEQLDAASMSSLVPQLKPGVIEHGLLDRVGGDLDVDAILQQMLRTYKTSGGELRLHSPVEKLEFKGQWRVEILSKTGSAVFEAPVIVNAAGAWADNIAALANLEPLGLQPKRRTAILVDGDNGWSKGPLTIDVDEHFYFKPDAGQLLISPADETPSVACDAHAEEMDIAIAIDRVQQIADIPVRKINHRWAGLRTFAPDKSFVLGFDPRAEGFFWCAGQGGYGVQSAPGVARLARQLCLGQTPARPQLVSKVSPGRLL